MNLYLMRHGETNWNKRGKLQGQVNTKLAPEGIFQAQRTAEGLKDVPFDHIFASPLRRASMTAHIVRGERDVPIVHDERLMEIAFGTAEGRRIAKMRRNPNLKIYDRFRDDTEHYRPPKGGERFEAVIERTSDFLSEKIFPLEGEAENVLIAAHGCACRCMLLTLMGRPLRDLWETPFGKNCSVAQFRIEGGKAELVSENTLYYSEEEVLALMPKKKNTKGCEVSPWDSK